MTRPIPIAFGITDLDVGGAEKAFVEMVTRLDRDRWSPSVVCLKPVGLDWEQGTAFVRSSGQWGNREQKDYKRKTNLAGRLVGAGIAIESLGMTSVLQTGRALHQWRRILQDRKPAVLVTFLFHANMLGRWIARRMEGVRHVSSVRVAERAQRWHLALDRWTSRWTDHYVCVSESVAQFTRESLQVAENKVSVIPNGVDLAAVDAARLVDLRPYNIESNDLLLLALGRLDQQKNPELLVDAVGKIPESARQHGLRVAFVGDGPRRHATQAAVQRLGLAEFFRFPGPTENPLGWLKASQGLVLSSDWEGMPNVVLEAMAAEKPVIATAVDGVVDVVQDEGTGWLTAPGSAGLFSQKILDWMTSPDKRRDFGLAGRRRVEECFRIESTVEQWERLLDRIVR